MTLPTVSPDQSVFVKETYEKYVKWKPSSLKGLKGIPDLGKWNERDFIKELPFNWHPIVAGGNGQFSRANGETLKNLINSKPNASLFVEIGTAAAFAGSSTETFLKNKKDDTLFFTIDIVGRENITLGKPKSFFIVERSTNENVKKHIADNKIDILFIDGDHSVKAVFEEYEFYLPYMKQDGIIILHDTNLHPGPFLFMEAINENIFRKERLHPTDLGLGVVYLG